MKLYGDRDIGLLALKQDQCPEMELEISRLKPACWSRDLTVPGPGSGPPVGLCVCSESPFSTLQHPRELENTLVRLTFQTLARSPEPCQQTQSPPTWQPAFLEGNPRGNAHPRVQHSRMFIRPDVDGL